MNDRAGQDGQQRRRGSSEIRTAGVEEMRAVFAARDTHRARACPPGLPVRAGVVAGPGKEHGQQRRRGVFDVDEDRALDALAFAWGDAYDVGCEDGQWVASRRDDRGGALTGETPDELNRQMRADWGIR
jgi:hypothetical protein